MDWKRGAYPEFTVEDAVAVLFLMRNPIGRKTVSELLDLGEGSVRTLLRKLSRQGLIESSQRGHVLSEKGKELVERLSKSFSEAHAVGKVEGLPAYAIMINSPPEFKSIELRDEAIRFFARGAMILIVKNGEVVFPEDGRPLKETMPDLAEKLSVRKPEEGNMVVVTWAENPADAMKSAYHVAVFLKDVPEEIKSLVR